MKLTRTSIAILTLLGAGSLLGLVILQYALLRNAYDFREQAFERNVQSAMSTIARRLEMSEAVGNVLRVAVSANAMGKKFTVVRIEKDSSGVVKKFDSPMREMPLSISGDTIRYDVFERQRVTLRLTDIGGTRDTMLFDGMRDPGEHRLRVSDPDLSKGEYVVKYFAGGASYTLHTRKGTVEGIFRDANLAENRETIVGRVIDNLSIGEREPVERRIQPEVLDTLIADVLKESDIRLPYSYGVISGRSDSLRLVSDSGSGRELLSTPFRTELFPSDFLFGKTMLLLHFPTRERFLLKQMTPLLGLTVLLMTVVIACFGYTIRVIIRQKDFAARIVNFINNMTHEFKTPLSTIAVAAETITRPDIAGQHEKVARYGQVILDENTRMRGQVERILQMASLEEGSEGLSVRALDLHEILRTAIHNLSFQVDSRGGRVSSDLRAVRSTILGDAVHLSNIIHNILDNAMKYSPGSPEMLVTTTNDREAIVVSICDRGTGMDRSELTKVFEKYYRVPTGNVHDVKGFGLGLAYVKLMTEAQGGSVWIESERGKGATVRLRFPLKEDE